MYIKDNIQLEEATRLLDENYSLFSELEGSCSSKNLEFERMSASFREKLYMKEQRSFSLESELTLKTKEVEVLRTELGKLKELKEEFGSFEPMEASSVDRADSGGKL